VIVISHNGDMLDYDITKSFDQDYKSVENLKNLVSMRFSMGEFAEGQDEEEDESEDLFDYSQLED